MSEEKESYESLNNMVIDYLEKRGYTSIESNGNSKRYTFTYLCEQDGMPYWVKIGLLLDDEGKRIKELRNEVAAITALWKAFPEGETDSFILPPGPEMVFDEQMKGYAIYGYSRFVVEGRVLAHDLRDGTESFVSWVDRFAAMMRTIDSLPGLGLPRTDDKKKENFAEIINKCVGIWMDLIEKNGSGELKKCSAEIAKETEEYLKKHTVVTGTVHGNLIPDHIVYLDGQPKPTVVNFSKLCQWYPRFWDAGEIYGWVQAVLADSDAAKAYKENVTSNGYDKQQLEHFKMVFNVCALGMMATHIDPAAEGGILKVGCEVFEK